MFTKDAGGVGIYCGILATIGCLCLSFILKQKSLVVDMFCDMLTYVYNLVLHVGNCFSLGKWNYYCGVPRFVKNIVVRL